MKPIKSIIAAGTIALSISGCQVLTDRDNKVAGATIVGSGAGALLAAELYGVGTGGALAMFLLGSAGAAARQREQGRSTERRDGHHYRWRPDRDRWPFGQRAGRSSCGRFPARGSGSQTEAATRDGQLNHEPAQSIRLVDPQSGCAPGAVCGTDLGWHRRLQPDAGAKRSGYRIPGSDRLDLSARCSTDGNRYADYREGRIRDCVARGARIHSQYGEGR